MNNLLVIGKGGREHAIAIKLKQSSKVNKVFVMPGSNAIDQEGIESVDINPLDFDKAINFAKDNSVELTIIGPEVELEAGIVDAFEAKGLKVFGPDKYTAQVESSKSFAKEKMEAFDIPTAFYKVFDTKGTIMQYLYTVDFPIVLKVDGLAGGKGVTIPESIEEATKIVNDIFKGGSIKSKIVVEEFLMGEEFSLLAFIKGKTISYMQIAQDHKRAYDDDKGHNTGGMGAYTPVEHISNDELEQGKEIVKKMAYGLDDEGTPFKGVLYAGLISTPDGVKTIEFNARFGDPETEVILPAMKSDLYEVVTSVMNNKSFEIEWHNKSFVGVVLASKGYPGKYELGNELNIDMNDIGNNIYLMGVKKQDDKFLSNGGRVLLSVGVGENLAQAKAQAYDFIGKIKVDKFFYRNDISNKGAK